MAIGGAIATVGWFGPTGRANTASASAEAPASATSDCNSLTTCYTPHQLEVAYGIVPLLDHGTNGRGETVVLPELAEPQFPLRVSDIRQDLAQFDKLFHLPATRLRAVTSLAPSASPWLANGEEVLDTEMVHAIAPGAAIVEVLVKATSLNNPSQRRSGGGGRVTARDLAWGHYLDQRRRPDRGGALRHPRGGGRPAQGFAGCCQTPRDGRRRLR